MASENISWNLESFVDALVVELDKTRETLAVKAINKPLSYTVKDMSLDLQIFPTYDGEEVQFTTAKPGQQGASKVSLQLASITDDQVRSTSKKPASKEDVKLDQMPIDDTTKKTLRKIGITSVKDLEEVEKKNVDLEKVSPQKINYSNLANIIQKSKRDTIPPKVSKVSMSMSGDQPVLIIKGDHLAINEKFKPVAVINNSVANVIKYDSNEIQIAVDKAQLEKSNNEMIVTLDPYSVFKMSIKN